MAAEPRRPEPGAPWSGAVLTGGRSERMGRDKALLDVGGHPLAAIAMEALRGAGAAEVLAVGGDLPALEALGFDHVVPDDHPGQGPLGGLLTAFRVADHDVAVVLACDLPGASREAIGTVLAALGGHDAAVPMTDRYEPLHAAWRVGRCRPVLAGRFAAGERAIHRALAGLDVVEVRLGDAALHNVNRPGDLPR